MSDVNPEQYAEFVTEDGPGSADADEMSQVPQPPEQAQAATDLQTGEQHERQDRRAQATK
ncbi:hypothetical protein [Actinoplanes sp. TFC3]|uniref:hypothetical protein n=1 Tax=Actinoplanes sp. TFC3 TaxID=1710355 RepID=UPI00082CECA8|nr:hypothetical protein [Actinoplanes sp. TFC3]